MIIFHGTKRVGTQSFLIFTNEAGSFVQIPVDGKIQNMFLHHFDRLSPSVKDVDQDDKSNA